MISEKTVELNLTTEFINWLSHLYSQPFFAVGPTQAQEARWGFDAGVFGGVSGSFIQYKRAYVNGPVWEWRLNRTKAQDQLLRLKNLEAAGCAVFYALPFFHTVAEVQRHRRRLLLQTFWFRPSQINPSSGPCGHHEIRYDTTSGKWSVHSEEESKMPEPLSHWAVVDAIKNPSNELSFLASAFNSVVLDDDIDLHSDNASRDDLLLRGACIIGC